MPFPLLAAAGIAAPLIGGAINAISGSSTNRSNQRFTEYMWNKENEQNDAIWRRDTEYNSPSAQMSRLASAGLNPNLVYGNGSVAGGSAPHTSSASAPQGQSRPTEPGQGLMSLGNMLGIYQDFQLKQAQTDNAKAQNELIAAQAQSLRLDNQYKEITLPDRATTVSYNKQFAGNRNIDLSQRINFDTDANPLRLKSMTYDLANKALIPGYTKAGTQLRLQQVDFNMLEKQLNSMGISRRDGPMWRIAGSLLHTLFPNIKLNQ